MATVSRTGARGPDLAALALPALTITLGLQTLRVLMPHLAWYLKDTVGVSSPALAGYAFGTFLIGFLAAQVWRAAGPQPALRLTAGGVAALRLAEQLSRDPALDLWLSMAGAALFVLFLPIAVGTARAHGGPDGGPRLAYGLLLGLALDSALKGLTGTLDLSWVRGAAPTVATAALAAGVLWAAWREPAVGAEAPSEATWGDALPLLAVGPYLLLQAMVLQNIGWVSEVTRLPTAWAYALVMLGNLLAVLGAAWGMGHPRRLRGALGALAAAFLTLAAAGAGQRGLAMVAVFGAMQLLLGWGWALLYGAAARPARPGLGRTTLLHGLGMLLFLLLAFIYYVSLELPIPVPRGAFVPAAAAVTGVLTAWAAARVAPRPAGEGESGAALLAAAGLALVALGAAAALGRGPGPQSPRGLPLRVMTYNIHSAFDVEGRQDPEAIARVIEDSRADIVALQEVSRGWLINGSTDLAGWLSRRLGMPFLFRGTADAVWGNALLSRYPIVDHGWGDLPLAGTRLPRGYLWAEIEVGAAQPLLVIVTHLHHVEGEHGPRLAQVPVLLEAWGGRPFSLLMGDLNAEPGYPEIELFAQAGLLDAWAAGEGPGLTWPAYGPFERIDWVWHTGDLRPLSAEAIETTASDHLPVVVEFEGSP